MKRSLSLVFIFILKLKSLWQANTFTEIKKLRKDLLDLGKMQKGITVKGQKW